MNKDEEERIKRLVAEGKIRSVYVFVRKAVQDLIAEKTKEKDYWWRQDKK